MRSRSCGRGRTRGSKSVAFGTGGFDDTSRVGARGGTSAGLTTSPAVTPSFLRRNARDACDSLSSGLAFNCADGDGTTHKHQHNQQQATV